MAKRQTRRSISVSKETYEKLKAVGEATNTSMSAMVEAALAPILFPGDAVSAVAGDRAAMEATDG